MKKKKIGSYAYPSRSKSFIFIIVITILFFLFFSFILLRVFSLQTTHMYGERDLAVYSQKQYRENIVEPSSRGIIYDVNGQQLAINVTEYDIFAILSDTYLINNEPAYIIDPTTAANSLADILAPDDPAAYNYFYETLTKNQYQVEFGRYGQGISHDQKRKLDEANLTGLYFTEKKTRYNPYGDFASYLIGYAKTDDEGQMAGEMGIEAYQDDYLRGQDGKITFESDKFGQPIGNVNELVPKADGANLYLTIDKTIQSFLEEANNDVFIEANPTMMFSIVMDAKTGAILAATSKPSFNPNIRDIENYSNPMVSYCYEPGSTFKTFLLAAAINAKAITGNENFTSGKRLVSSPNEPEVIISD